MDELISLNKEIQDVSTTLEKYRGKADIWKPEEKEKAVKILKAANDELVKLI